jgi:hypothetical protein
MSIDDAILQLQRLSERLEIALKHGKHDQSTHGRKRGGGSRGGGGGGRSVSNLSKQEQELTSYIESQNNMKRRLQQNVDNPNWDKADRDETKRRIRQIDEDIANAQRELQTARVEREQQAVTPSPKITPKPVSPKISTAEQQDLRGKISSAERRITQNEQYYKLAIERGDRESAENIMGAIRRARRDIRDYNDELRRITEE